MRQLTIMLSELQYQAYESAASNYSGVSEWARLVLEYTLMGKLTNATDNNVWTQRISPMLRRKAANRFTARSQRVSIRVPPAVYKKLELAATASNVKIAVLCVLILDYECGLSYLSGYFHETPSAVKARDARNNDILRDLKDLRRSAVLSHKP